MSLPCKSLTPFPTASPQTSSALFFQYNSQLGPPYHILVDTNFVNFSIQNKLDLVQGMMDCLCAKCVPCITDCVVGELEKLGSKFRVAQRYCNSVDKRIACVRVCVRTQDYQRPAV